MFQLLAEQFDNGLFQILAWRGREREELTGRMHAADGEPGRQNHWPPVDGNAGHLLSGIGNNSGTARHSGPGIADGPGADRGCHVPFASAGRGFAAS